MTDCGSLNILKLIHLRTFTSYFIGMVYSGYKVIFYIFNEDLHYLCLFFLNDEIIYHLEKPTSL